MNPYRRLIAITNKLLHLTRLQISTAGEWERLERTVGAYRDQLQAINIGRSGASHLISEYIKHRKLLGLEEAGLKSDSNTPDLEQLVDVVKTQPSFIDDELNRFIRSFCEFASLSRSQWAQDGFVWHVTQGRRRGRYLEIGAADGVTHSNTLALRDFFGWSGILIEPHPEAFKKLQTNRGGSADLLLNVAAGPPTAKPTIKLIDAGQLSCVDGQGGDDHHKTQRSATSRKFDVKQVPFETIISDVGPLDYLSLDVEGAELQMLTWIPWRKISPPKVITVEHNWRLNDQLEIVRLLTAEGYNQWFRGLDWVTRGDFWFSHESSMLKST